MWKLKLENLVCRSPQQVSQRLDRLISMIKEHIMNPKNASDGSTKPQNVVCVAHGHILSALALRWAQLPLEHGVRVVIHTASVAVLGYVLSIFPPPANKEMFHNEH